MQYSYVKIIRVQLTYLALLVSSTATAEPYTWAISFVFGQKFSTPQAACEAYFEKRKSEHLSRYPGTPVTFTRVERTKLSETQVRCDVYIRVPPSAGDAAAYNDVASRSGTHCQDLNDIINPTTDNCGKDQQKGPPPPKSCQANPINIATGGKYQFETDYSAKSNSKLNFSRTYNSLDGAWPHSYSTRLRFAGSTVAALVMHHGRELFFSISGSTVTPRSSGSGVLTKLGTTGWQYISTDNERFTFDTAGKLSRWSNAHGGVHQFAYTGNQVTVTDNLGNSLTFTEDANKQPLTLTAPGVQITYGYNAAKRLTSVTKVMGGQTTLRQFHYEDPRNNSWLTGITDERGVRYATWSYDDKGRATSSEHADGADKVTVAYNADGTVSVTNELGKVAKYSFQYIKGVNLVTAIQGEPSANCPNSNSSFTYDSNGLLKTKTDNKGVLTTYTYNARGLEISRTEASGTAQARTITTDWHPTLLLPTVVTEPKRITTYHYDDQGRQLGRTVEER